MGNTVRLRPPNNQLNRRCVLWWRAWTALVVVPVVAALTVIGLLAAPVLVVLAGIVAACGIAYGVIMPLWWYSVHRWEVTEAAVYTRTGYFWQESRIAPMSRIQTVDTVRGPLQQLLRLATVTVTTASAKGAVRIAGLDAELAADLAAELTRITEATPGDAT